MHKKQELEIDQEEIFLKTQLDLLIHLETLRDNQKDNLPEELPQVIKINNSYLL